MDLSSRLVDSREKGEVVPISIGTARAVESLCGVGDFMSPDPPLKSYDAVWVNIRTLFRNFYNALSRESRGTLLPEEMLVGLKEDWLILQGTIRQGSHGQSKATLYYCSMEGFEAEFPNARYKNLSTQRQKEEQAAEDAVIKAYFESLEEEEILTYNVKITGNHPRVAIVTHYPVDLLWYRTFTKLELVESHTGTIKTRADWHTKLTGGHKLSYIPFNRLTIQVFGDGNVLFASMLPSVKNEISELALVSRWHSLTTTEKIRQNLNKIYDPRVKGFFRSLL